MKLFEKTYNWLLKQLFYFRYFVLKQGDSELYGEDIIFPNLPTFQSYSFKDGNWLKCLPWDTETKATNWNTFGIFDQQYGKFYFDAILDGLATDKGWPAIWLLELTPPVYYEIDIELFKEHFGYTIWWNDNGPQETGNVSRAMFGSKKLYCDLQQNYHLFLIDWSEDWIKYYLDGILTARFRNVMKKPMKLIMSKLGMKKVVVNK